MTDIFEKKEGKKKLKELLDVNSQGRNRFYRIKTISEN